MPLFRKLFSSTKKPHASHADDDDALPQLRHAFDDAPLAGIAYERSFVRVVVMRQSDAKGRQVLFDSESVYRRLASSDIGSTPSASCPNFDRLEARPDKKLKRRSDSNILAEMIFGSAPLAYRGVTMKVHELREPARIMLTRIFPSTRRIGQSSTSRPSSGGVSPTSTASASSCLSSFFRPADIPFEVPARLERHSDDDFMSVESGEQRAGSVSGSDSTCASSSGVTATSTDKRLIRSYTGDLELAMATPQLLIPATPASDSPYSRQRPPMIGCAVTLRADERCREIIFRHYSTLEAKLARLCLSVNDLYQVGGSITEGVAELVEAFSEQVVSFFNADRLGRNLWASGSDCKQFVPCLMELVEMLERKTFEFFLSRLLTAVLCHHLAWTDRAESDEARCRLSSSYNPLWAQLSDLWGAVGPGGVICRTVLVGQPRHHTLLMNLELVLTYFLRCNRVAIRRVHHQYAQTSAETLPERASFSPTIPTVPLSCALESHSTTHVDDAFSSYPLSYTAAPRSGGYMCDIALQVCSTLDFAQLRRDLVDSVQFPPVDDDIKESIAIVADIDRHTVRVTSSRQFVPDAPPLSSSTQRIFSDADDDPELLSVDCSAAGCIMSLLDTVSELSTSKGGDSTDDLVISYIEEQLEHIHCAGLALANYMQTARHVDTETVTALLGLQPSDLPLLIAAASTHSLNLVSEYT